MIAHSLLLGARRGSVLKLGCGGMCFFYVTDPTLSWGLSWDAGFLPHVTELLCEGREGKREGKVVLS